jgi:hypothetical protein
MLWRVTSSLQWIETRNQNSSPGIARPGVTNDKGVIGKGSESALAIHWQAKANRNERPMTGTSWERASVVNSCCPLRRQRLLGVHRTDSVALGRLENAQLLIRLLATACRFVAQKHLSAHGPIGPWPASLDRPEM